MVLSGGSKTEPLILLVQGEGDILFKYLALLVQNLNSYFETKIVCILCGGAHDYLNIWE